MRTLDVEYFRSFSDGPEGEGGCTDSEGRGAQAPRDAGLVGSRCRVVVGRNAFADVERWPKVPPRFLPGRLGSFTFFRN